MPWVRPDLDALRRKSRDNLTAYLPGADAAPPNTPLRVMSDNNAELAQEVLEYAGYIADEIMVDTSTDFLPRHGSIWGQSQKPATLATGSVIATGVAGVIVPAGTQLTGSIAGVTYETTEAATLEENPTEIPITAITGGVSGNLPEGASLRFAEALSGVDAAVEVVTLAGGVDVEDVESLRSRILFRIQKPPMGGADYDYIRWAREVPGVSRAWAFPQEMGIGTMTVRFVVDEPDLANPLSDIPVMRMPTEDEVNTVATYINTKRPVTVRDFWVLAPIEQPLTFVITDLSRDDAPTRGAIEAALRKMLYERATPGGTIYRSWADEAISGALGEDHHELDFDTEVMPSPGHIAVLGSIAYV